MRTLSSDLTDAQEARSPRARVACTVEQRGLTPGATPWSWSSIVANTGQSSWPAVTACTKNDGETILRFKVSGTNVQIQTISDPTDSSEWTGNAWSNIITGVLPQGMAALRVSTTIRLFYDDVLTGDVKYIESTDNASTWGSPVTVYSGGDAAGDVCVAYVDPAGPTNQSGWIVGFSTYAGGVYNPHFDYYVGAAWVDTATTNNWRCAGIDAHNIQSGQTHLDVFIFRAQDLGTSRLRHIELDTGVYSNAVDIDETQAGLFGLAVSAWRFTDLNITQEITLGTALENGDGSGIYLGICGLLYSEEFLADEPIIFPDAVTPNDASYFTFVESGDDLYLIGDTYVQRAQEQSASSSTLYPIKYKYDNHQLEIEFEPDIDALYVGQLLVLSRTISWGTKTGTESIRFYVARVYTGTDIVRVLALDAVGFLGQARCRRSYIVNDGTADGLAQVLRRMCARFGIPATSDDSNIESASVLPLTIQPSESLLGAAYRITSQSRAYLVPANDGSWGVTIITPGTSDVSGDYDDTAYTYPIGESPIHRAATISDWRRFAFAFILGQNSTDPEDGSSVGMAQGPYIDNTHPLSVSLTNTRYNSQARVEAAAEAEAERQDKLPITAIILANANLALEQYDVVSITHADMGWSSTQFRIRNIIERWEAHTLIQEIHLGNP